MKVIHEVGFSKEEMDTYRRQVFMNLWDGMRSCLEAMQELGLRLSNDENRVSLLFTVNTATTNSAYRVLGQSIPLRGGPPASGGRVVSERIRAAHATNVGRPRRSSDSTAEQRSYTA